MNRNMNIPVIQRTMKFERENDMIDQRQEVMDDAIDDVFEDEGEESDEIVNQVLDEIGIYLSQSVTPRFFTCFGFLAWGKLLRVFSRSNLARVPEAIGADDNLQARLDSLKNEEINIWRI